MFCNIQDPEKHSKKCKEIKVKWVKYIIARILRAIPHINPNARCFNRRQMCLDICLSRYMLARFSSCCYIHVTRAQASQPCIIWKGLMPDYLTNHRNHGRGLKIRIAPVQSSGLSTHTYNTEFAPLFRS